MTGLILRYGVLILLGFGMGFGAGKYVSRAAYLALSVEYERYKSAQEKAVADAREKVKQMEDDTRTRLDKAALDAYNAKKHDEAIIDRLTADLRSGSVRLSVATRNCASSAANTRSTDAAAAPAGNARSELLPQVAIDLVGIARDCNREVRERNEVIARYNSLREQP
jgi:hypothetical protein